jgi:hypothetical protein
VVAAANWRSRPLLSTIFAPPSSAMPPAHKAVVTISSGSKRTRSSATRTRSPEAAASKHRDRTGAFDQLKSARFTP